jgi:hypothetical protein
MGDMMPVISKNDGFPITLKVPAQRFSKRFHTEEEVYVWIDKEILFWETMNTFPQGSGVPIARQHLQFLKQLSSEIFIEANGHGAAHARLNYIDESGVLLSEGRQANFLSRLKKNDPTLYPGAFAAMASTLQPINARRYTQGNQDQLPWALWLSGLGGMLKFFEFERSAASEREEIRKLGASSRDLLEEIQTKSREVSELHETHKERLEILGKVHVDAFKQALEDYRAQFQDQLRQSKASIFEFENLIHERLAIEAPTAFWTAKARSHRNVAILFGLIFLVAIGSGVYWITHFGVDLVAEAYRTIVGDRETPGLLALVPLAFITLPTLAFAWILRHISRIVVQNLALQADAQLRSTIANTYTALTSQNKSTPAELAIALNALFRPIDGSGHSEIAPPNIRDILEAGK